MLLQAAKKKKKDNIPLKPAGPHWTLYVGKLAAFSQELSSKQRRNDMILPFYV